MKKKFTKDIFSIEVNKDAMESGKPHWLSLLKDDKEWRVSTEDLDTLEKFIRNYKHHLKKLSEEQKVS